MGGIGYEVSNFSAVQPGILMRKSGHIHHQSLQSALRLI
jgi:hypothetical protein